MATVFKYGGGRQWLHTRSYAFIIDYKCSLLEDITTQCIFILSFELNNLKRLLTAGAKETGNKPDQ